ncbi:MAG: hypothetical protein RSE41_04915 [Clostridia bacterium]
MIYIPIKNLTDKTNKKYNNKILSRRSIFRILNKFKSAKDNLIKIISKKEGKHTCINQDYLYLFYNKKYRLECSKYTEVSINFIEGYDRAYYINIANSLSKILSTRIIYTVELKDNINHLHLIIENSHVNKTLIENYLINELMQDESRVNKSILVTSVRDLDKFYHYINKSHDSKIISFESNEKI